MLTYCSRKTHDQVTDTLTKAKLTVRSDYHRGGRGVMLQLKNVKQSLPAHAAGMQDGIGVGEETLANLAGFPGVGRRVERHVDHHRRTNYILARDAAPEAAVVRVAAIVAHHKIAIVGDLIGSVQLIRLAGAERIRLGEFLSVDPHGAIVNIDAVARQADTRLT